jgi:2-dehydropantoate 2-reductase
MALVFVKFGQTREAVMDAAAMIGPQTLIVTLQNGIGNLDIIRSVHPNPVAYGLTTLTSDLVGPGRAECRARPSRSSIGAATLAPR